MATEHRHDQHQNSVQAIHQGLTIVSATVWVCRFDAGGCDWGADLSRLYNFTFAECPIATDGSAAGDAFNGLKWHQAGRTSVRNNHARPLAHKTSTIVDSRLTDARPLPISCSTTRAGQPHRAGECGCDTSRSQRSFRCSRVPVSAPLKDPASTSCSVNGKFTQARRCGEHLPRAHAISSSPRCASPASRSCSAHDWITCV